MREELRRTPVHFLDTARNGNAMPPVHEFDFVGFQVGRLRARARVRVVQADGLRVANYRPVKLAQEKEL